MMLTTPAIASEPYCDTAPVFTISMRSIALSGSVFKSKKVSTPFEKKANGATRCPSISTSVYFSLSPRNAMPEAPAAKLLDSASLQLSAELALVLRRKSETLLAPLSWISLAVTVWTWLKPTLSELRISEPVTSNRLTWATPFLSFVISGEDGAVAAELAPAAGAAAVAAGVESFVAAG